MELTKYTHSCVSIQQKQGEKYDILVIDPGTFSETAIALEDANNILITHEHEDHFDIDAIKLALRNKPDLCLWGPGKVVENFKEFPRQAQLALPGMRFQAGTFSIKTFGGQHALIHESIPIISNIGYLINDKIYHPGDSFSIPNFPLYELKIEVLLLPIQAPWSKLAEVLDFLIAIKPKQAYQIHDALLENRGLNITEKHIKNIADRFGLDFTHLKSGETVTI